MTPYPMPRQAPPLDTAMRSSPLPADRSASVLCTFGRLCDAEGTEKIEITRVVIGSIERLLARPQVDVS